MGRRDAIILRRYGYLFGDRVSSRLVVSSCNAGPEAAAIWQCAAQYKGKSLGFVHGDCSVDVLTMFQGQFGSSFISSLGTTFGITSNSQFQRSLRTTDAA